MPRSEPAGSLWIVLPAVRRPLYWELEVTNIGVWIYLRKRPFHLWRNATDSIGAGFILHDGHITPELLDKISQGATRIVANRRGDKAVFDALVGCVDTRQVKVVLDR